MTKWHKFLDGIKFEILYVCLTKIKEIKLWKTN